MHKFNYDWRLADGYPAPGIKPNGCTVFSTFSCGGGSSMGYKLAGYNVIGAEDIDPKMQALYEKNHHPKYYFLDGVKTLKDREDLPEELYHLDILDGSPPCSNFSMAGNREDDWGKEKKFREGQAKQVLDTLFFDFIDLAAKLKPKVVIAENVKGLLIGAAKEYVTRILSDFDKAGYAVSFYLLNSSTMGVPQARNRVFFIAIRKDLLPKLQNLQYDLFGGSPILKMEFDEEPIPYKEIEEKEGNANAWGIYPGVKPYWEKIEPGRSCADVHPKGHFFQELKLHPDKPLPTLRAGSNSYYHYKDERKLFDMEITHGGSFPTDYDYNKQKPIYVVGMSVPPVMMAQVSNKVYEQVLSRLK